MESLKNLLKVLVESDIDFVIIGGFAATLYGSTQVTQDIDICSPLNPKQIEKFRRFLAPFNPKHRMTPKKLSFTDFPKDLKGVKNLYIKTDLGVLDILGEVTGVGSFEEIAKRASYTEFSGKKVKIISIDDLIKVKELIGRPKDEATALELKVIRGKKGK